MSIFPSPRSSSQAHTSQLWSLQYEKSGPKGYLRVTRQIAKARDALRDSQYPTPELRKLPAPGEEECLRFHARHKAVMLWVSVHILSSVKSLEIENWTYPCPEGDHLLARERDSTWDNCCKHITASHSSQGSCRYRWNLHWIFKGEQKITWRRSGWIS